MPSRSAVFSAGSVLRRWFPILAWLPAYQRTWLRDDVIAGLALTALLVPQGMAYAQLAGLPPITGLYTSVMCLIAYALTGPSRVLVLGPDSSLGPMIAATLLPLLAAGGDPGRAVILAAMLSILVGLLMIAAGAAKLGFIADLLSKPTQIGYMNGLALTILVGQVRKLLGFSVEADGLIGEVLATLDKILDGATNPATLAVGAASLAIVLLMQRVLPRIPAVLVAVVAATAASSLLDLPAYGVKVVGSLPQGFPPFSLPLISVEDLSLLVAGALGITLVALADTISTASAYARRAGVDFDGNQEMIGIGFANLLSGLFQGFAVSTSGSRTGSRLQERSPYPGDRSSGRRRHPGAAGTDAEPARRLADPDAGGDCSRCGFFAGRNRRRQKVVGATQNRVLAVHSRHRRSGRTGCVARHRCRRGAIDTQRVPPRLVAVSGAARSYPCCSLYPTPPSIRPPDPCPDWLFSVSMLPCSLPMRAPSPSRWSASPIRRATPQLDPHCSRTDFRHRYHGGGHDGTDRRSRSAQYPVGIRRTEGTGSGQAGPVPELVQDPPSSLVNYPTMNKAWKDYQETFGMPGGTGCSFWAGK